MTADTRLADGDHAPRRIRDVGSSRAHSLVLETWNDFRDRTDDEIDYAIDGIAPTGGVGFVAAGSKNGKTWIGLYCGVAVAAGKPFLGHETRPSNVVYIALEGARANIRARIGCLARGLGVDPDGDALHRLHLIYKPRRIDLRDKVSAAELISKVSHLPPGLLIVDVLRRGARIRESGEGVGDFTDMLTNLEPLTSKGWTVILLHHFKKWGEFASGADTGDRMSGSGALFGHADFAIFIVRANRETRTHQLEFVTRDAAPIPPRTVRLHGAGSGRNGALTYRDRALFTSEGDNDAVEQRVEAIDAAILAHVERHPGLSQNKVISGVGGNAADARKRLRALVQTGQVVVEKGPRKTHRHYPPALRPSISDPVGRGGVAATASVRPTLLRGTHSHRSTSDATDAAGGSTVEDGRS